MRRRVLRTAVAAAATSLLLSACEFSAYDIPLPGGADVGEDSYLVTVQFRDVLDLVPQSAVKVDDVTVGRVESIELKGWIAEVQLRLRGDVQLPDNAYANLRQTSLLGEKFVSLSPPPTGQGSGSLQDGELIPLERTGRNPEVEEVLAAMALLLNGGGVAQLRTISVELTKALEGNEQSVRSVLSQLDEFMGQLDTHKRGIVRAIEALNRLAVSVKGQQLTIERALDRMPAALDSIDKQRDDLVRMLDELGRLSVVGTRVIRESKETTLQSLESMAPILASLADAGDALPRTFSLFLTYPFPDSVVGKTAAEARSTHLGDYSNLSVQLDVNLTRPIQVPDLPGVDLPDLELPPLTGGDGTLPLPEAPDAPDDPLVQVPPLPGAGGGSSSPSPSPEEDDDCVGVIVNLCRVAPAYAADAGAPTSAGSDRRSADAGYDADLAAMLLQAVAR